MSNWASCKVLGVNRALRWQTAIPLYHDTCGCAIHRGKLLEEGDPDRYLDDDCYTFLYNIGDPFSDWYRIQLSFSRDNLDSDILTQLDGLKGAVQGCCSWV